MTVMLQNRRLPAVVILVLCAAPLCAEAQQFACWPIVRGDTASGLARRLTGVTATVYSDAFQIRDPARRMFVPKSQYSRLSTAWQVCVARERVKKVQVELRPPSVPTATAAAAVLPPPLFDAGFALRFSGAVSLILLMITAVSSYAAPRPVPLAEQCVGEAFIRAFAMPLIDPTSPVPPIAARLRFSRRKRLEVCLAPHGGRRYPNLSDHKKNVEYDVNRVLRILGAHRMVCDRLHAEGQWVIVSIRLTEPNRQV